MRAVIVGFGLGFAAPFALSAQGPMEVLRGELVSASASGFEMRLADKTLIRCTYDFRTYFERESQRVTAENIDAGETLELIADHKPGTSVCFARTVHVIDPNLKSKRWRPNPSPTESFAPRGDLTYSGVVTRQNKETVTLRTRAGDVTLIKRLDTKYLDGGQRADTPAVNTRVFVRAGKNLDGELEAYQMIWGAILKD